MFLFSVFIDSIVPDHSSLQYTIGQAVNNFNNNNNKKNNLIIVIIRIAALPVLH